MSFKVIVEFQFQVMSPHIILKNPKKCYPIISLNFSKILINNNQCNNDGTRVTHFDFLVDTFRDEDRKRFSFQYALLNENRKVWHHQKVAVFTLMLSDMLRRFSPTPSRSSPIVK